MLAPNGAESEANEMIVDENLGDDAANPGPMVGAKALSRVSSISRVSKSKSSGRPPLPNFKSKTQPQYNEELSQYNVEV